VATLLKIGEASRQQHARRKTQNMMANGVNHTVVSVEDAGYQDVYDMRVPGADNFVANGVVVHNSGKSTIFDALDWGLYGEVPREDHVDSVIHDGVASCRVAVEVLADGGEPLKTQRIRERDKKTTLSINWGGVQREVLDLAESQKILEGILGMDREVFHAAVYFSQDAIWNFMDATDAQRIEILTRILGLGNLEEYRERAKQKLDALKLQQQGLVGKQQQLQGELSALQGIDFSRQFADWDERHAVALSNFAVRIETAKRGLAEATIGDPKTIIQLEEKVRAIQTNRVDLKNSWEHIGEAKGSRDKWIMQQRLAEDKLRDGQKRIDTLRGQSGATCSACGQVISGDHVAREIMQEEQRLLVARGEVATAEAAVEQWVREVLRTEVVYQHAVQEDAIARQVHQAAMQEAVRQLEVAKAANRVWRQAQQALDLAQGDYQREQQAQNPYVQKMQEHQTRVAYLGQKQAEFTAELDTLSRTTAYYEFWHKAFGPRGLVSYVLDFRLNELTAAVNTWVKILTGGTFWVRFETQTLGRSTGKLANKINPRLFRWNQDGTISERNYRSWSGGEKRRVAWAVDFGMSRLVAARARQSYDLLILDEVFNHVDSAGGEAVVEMLRGLRAERSSIFVVEHDSTFQSHFDRQILVVRQNGCSFVDAEKQATAEVSSVAPQSQGTPGGGSVQARKPVRRQRRPRATD
jgi:DNA repair exonuclease SbcCD ATPase subunit